MTKHMNYLRLLPDDMIVTISKFSPWCNICAKYAKSKRSTELIYFQWTVHLKNIRIKNKVSNLHTEIQNGVYKNILRYYNQNVKSSTHCSDACKDYLVGILVKNCGQKSYLEIQMDDHELYTQFNEIDVFVDINIKPEYKFHKHYCLTFKIQPLLSTTNCIKIKWKN